MKKILALLCVALLSHVCADDLKIAVGAGYKKPVGEVLKAYEESGHEKIDAMYGNMAQIFAQAKQTDISLVLADKKFLEKQKELTFVKYQTIGTGIAVIAYAKGVNFDSIEDLTKESIKTIAMPEAKKAIYGDAGMELLNNAKLYERVKEKLLVVATVPQVSSYVATHEVDVGIMNLTAALDNIDKMGGYIKIPQAYYTPIEIVAGSLKTCETDTACQAFVAFLKTSKAKEIFTKYGL
ncbi:MULTISPECIES: molybdate ABC transporter substrate-binding protein [unclassified Sulfurospirillum]|uniref:molybdate ABC transporter substrate-binding protein n=1 Tax=unclassified Sulfurospirillum TaxID=2618290 RepID=UPI000AAF43EB|nr:MULTISPECIES: molybdate ABC transporter substrate-binding protein [unclassified Sulfurospirillum]